MKIFFPKTDPQHFLNSKPFTEVDVNLGIKSTLSVILNVNVLKVLWKKQADQWQWGLSNQTQETQYLRHIPNQFLFVGFVNLVTILFTVPTQENHIGKPCGRMKSHIWWGWML